MPTKDDGRWPVLYEAAGIAKPQLDEMDCAIMGLFCGPLTLASHLVGVRIFTDVYKNKEFALAAKFYAEIGCEIVAIVQPVASRIKSICIERDLVFESIIPQYEELIDEKAKRAPNDDMKERLISLREHGFDFDKIQENLEKAGAGLSARVDSERK